MPDPGYIYVLINASMPDLVKVGKTTRDPEERAKELSAATGVPTPFQLVFDAYVANCSQAEQLVHSILESEGFRLSANREFFNAPIKRAIRAVLQAEVSFPVTFESIPDLVSQDHSKKTEHSPEPGSKAWLGIFQEAERYEHGEGDVLRDHKRAITLYRKAMKLGAPEAPYRLANLLLDLNFTPKKRDFEEALDALKAGAASGHLQCYAELGLIFAGQRRHPEDEWISDTSNANKCLERYFTAVDPQSDLYPEAVGIAYCLVTEAAGWFSPGLISALLPFSAKVLDLVLQSAEEGKFPWWNFDHLRDNCKANFKALGVDITPIEEMLANLGTQARQNRREERLSEHLRSFARQLADKNLEEAVLRDFSQERHGENIPDYLRADEYLQVLDFINNYTDETPEELDLGVAEASATTPAVDPIQYSPPTVTYLGLQPAGVGDVPVERPDPAFRVNYSVRVGQPNEIETEWFLTMDLLSPVLERAKQAGLDYAAIKAHCAEQFNQPVPIKLTKDQFNQLKEYVSGLR